MAKAKPTTAGAATEARALIDLPALSVKAGELVSASADVLAPLIESGSVDPHPDAVAYVKGQGQPSQLDKSN